MKISDNMHKIKSLWFVDAAKPHDQCFLCHGREKNRKTSQWTTVIEIYLEVLVSMQKNVQNRSIVWNEFQLVNSTNEKKRPIFTFTNWIIANFPIWFWTLLAIENQKLLRCIQKLIGKQTCLGRHLLCHLWKMIHTFGYFYLVGM